MENILIIKKAVFETENRIAVFIPKEKDMMDKIKEVPDRKWSMQHFCWHFPYNAYNWGIFKNLFKDFRFDIRNEEAALVIPYAEMVLPPQLTLKKQPEKTVGKTTSSKQIEGIKTTFIAANIVEIETSLKPESKVEKAPDIQKTLTPEMILVTKASFWKGRLRLDFIYRPDWVDKIKKLENRRWHVDHKCWTVPHSPYIIDSLKKCFGDTITIDILNKDVEALHNAPTKPHYVVETPPQYKDEITKLEEKLILKRYSHTTIKTYKNHFAHFVYYYNSIAPADITKEQIIQYMLYRIKTHKISESAQNTLINAIKCYYEQVLGRDRTFYDLQRPKRPFQLPNVLSQGETLKLLESVENIKHRCILMAIYSGGLRLSEVINLRIMDIKRDDNCIFIKAGKGKKDRFTLLSPVFLSHLDEYLETYKPTYWLFEGQTGGQYSARSVQNILRDAVTKSGVNPFATVHTLRHSFATHMVLGGENLIAIQDLLGHESSETTQIYIHLSGEQMKKIQSPLDKLKF
jgi:integrase/recombinase XerD